MQINKSVLALWALVACGATIVAAEQERSNPRFLPFVVENHDSSRDRSVVKVNPSSIKDVPAISKTYQAILSVRNLVYSQETKNLALEKAIDERDYCGTKFWLEHGAKLTDNKSDLFFTVYCSGNILEQSIAEMLPFTRPKLATFESLLMLLNPYGIDQIKVNYFGKEIKSQHNFDETITYIIENGEQDV